MTKWDSACVANVATRYATTASTCFVMIYPPLSVTVRFCGPDLLVRCRDNVEANSTPRPTHLNNACLLLKPGGATYTKPVSGLPVKSICRAWGCASASL